MASVDLNSGPEENSPSFHANRQPALSATSKDDLPLFRFGLRQLLVFVAMLSTLLAVLVASHGLAAVVILFAATIVAMHVFATALGTRLQARTERDQIRQQSARADTNSLSQRASDHFAKLQLIRSAPRSPWHGRGCTYLPWLPRLVIGAMIAGGLGGGILLSGTIGHRTSLEGIIVGAASFAILGGWISFLGGNFYGVFRHGFRDALAEQQKDEGGPKSGL
jgi:hypothetical protein